MAPATSITTRVFVVGVPRSGTTLVQSLLAAHSATASFTESHFFDRHFTNLPLSSRSILTSNPRPRLREFLAENSEEPPAAADWFAQRGRTLEVRPLLPFRTRLVAQQLLAVLDELTLRRGRAVWVEKTPLHLRHIPLLERVSGPEIRTRFVHVIRDGLEVVASLRDASRTWERPHDLETCVARWNTEMRLSLERISSPSDHFVLYEQLASRPVDVLRSLLAALGLDWEPEILERYSQTAESLVTAEESWKAGVGRSIQRSGTSDRTLTAEQRDRVRRSLRQDLYDDVYERVVGRSSENGGARD